MLLEMGIDGCYVPSALGAIFADSYAEEEEEVETECSSEYCGLKNS